METNWFLVFFVVLLIKNSKCETDTSRTFHLILKSNITESAAIITGVCQFNNGFQSKALDEMNLLQVETTPMEKNNTDEKLVYDFSFNKKFLVETRDNTTKIVLNEIVKTGLEQTNNGSTTPVTIENNSSLTSDVTSFEDENKVTSTAAPTTPIISDEEIDREKINSVANSAILTKKQLEVLIESEEITNNSDIWYIKNGTVAPMYDVNVDEVPFTIWNAKKFFLDSNLHREIENVVVFSIDNFAQLVSLYVTSHEANIGGSWRYVGKGNLIRVFVFAFDNQPNMLYTIGCNYIVENTILRIECKYIDAAFAEISTTEGTKIEIRFKLDTSIDGFFLTREQVLASRLSRSGYEIKHRAKRSIDRNANRRHNHRHRDHGRNRQSTSKP